MRKSHKKRVEEILEEETSKFVFCLSNLIAEKGFGTFTQQEARNHIFNCYGKTLETINQRLSKLDFVLTSEHLLQVNGAFELASRTLDNHLKNIEANRFNVWKD